MKLAAPLATLGAILLWASPSAGQPAHSSASDAVVFVRVIANVSAEFEEAWRKTERRNLQVASGSGVIVSPSGYILTNHHVIELEDRTVEVDGREVVIRRTLDRIEVTLPSGQRLEASVFAADPEMDLAVLAVPGGGLPYLPLGDSDAVERGDSVTAIGYPFGRAIEVGRQQTDDVAPQATVTSGGVSAIRADDNERPRYFQVTNALNPGNSGGPIVDEEGYAVGVAVMRVTKADSVGFAIAINRAKEFLEQCGLDSALPSRRLTLGAASALPHKGLRLQMPYGFQDSLPGRLRVEASDQSSSDLQLRITRVATQWTPDRLERELLAGVLSGQGGFEVDAHARRSAKGQVWGRASRTTPDGARVTMQYHILSVPGEAILARYTAPTELAAFNRSVLRASLASIEVDRLLAGEPRPPKWRPGPLPEGWIREPDEEPAFVLTAPENFTISARYGMWEGATLAATIARFDVPEDGSYKRFGSTAGVSRVYLGQFLQVEQGVVQIELAGPQQRETTLAQWLREWRAALGVK
jgi:S1-C subfamily serine protease